MKFLLAYTAILIGLSNAQSNLYSQERTRPHKGGDPGGRLVDMKETKCPTFLATFTCPLDAATVGCDDLERPKLDKEALADMSDEDKAEMKATFRDTKKEFKQKLLTCVCCDLISVDDLLAAKGEAEVSQEVALVKEDSTFDTEIQEGRDGAEGVTYNVFAGQGCVEGSRGAHTLMVDSPQPIGYCQNHGMGKSAYNSIEVLGCSANCLCFKQWASTDPESDCDDTSALKGWNIKFSCFDKCLQDCNGVNCGDTAQPDTGMTRLQLTGSGQICDAPVSEEELLAQCQTTGMVMEDGKFVDDFVRESSFQSGGQSSGRPNSDGGMFGSQGGQGDVSLGSGGRPSGMGGGSSSGGRPNGMSGSRPNGMSGGSNGGGMSGGRPSGMSGSNGVGGRPGSSSSEGRPSGMGGGSKPEGVDIQSLLAEKCNEYDCASMSGQEIDCSRFDSMNTRGGRKNLLWCGCCRD